MITGSIWLIKLVIAHLLTDFVLQPAKWVRDRQEKHWASSRLYLHGAITGLVAWILMGREYWLIAIIILITHTLVDVWKSYRPQNVRYFLVDQFLHFVVILTCWYMLFGQQNLLQKYWRWWNTDPHNWILLAGILFLTTPAGILIAQLTGQWSKKIEDADNSLANAGKWIGIVERIIVLILVSQNQYSAIALLVTAKGIIRFNEKDRQEVKTEYLVIGTLLSIGIAIITGLVLKTI